ncbi:MAG: efflux RND transporter periplasmic adaptor subunit [Planctomycetota bacterium]|jgi:RND family efflux transporter MFP subunit
MKIVRTLLCFFAVNLLIPAVPAQTKPNEGITAITIPSADVTLSFVQPGLISKVLIKEGDKVKAEQMLIQQDLEAAEASLAQKKVDLKRLEWAAGRGSATDLEVEHARLEVKMAQITVDRMCLKSPIAGTIDKIEVEVGEAINGLADVVRVVKTDPLWVDVPVPLAEGRTLKVGQIAEVKFPGSKKDISQAKIIYVSTVADAASSTLRVRIEVPNKLKRPAGEHVRITFLAPEKQPVRKDIIKAEKPKDTKSN